MAGKIPYERDHVVSDLKENICEVFFTKVNGEQRRMRCSLRPDLLPQNANLQYIDEVHQKPENLNVVAVWDLEKNAWRAFRLDSIEYIQVVDTY